MILKTQITCLAYHHPLQLFIDIYALKFSVTRPLQNVSQSSKNYMPDTAFFWFHYLFIAWFRALRNLKKNGRWEGKWRQRQRAFLKYGGVCCRAPLSSSSWISTTTIRWSCISPSGWVPAAWLSPDRLSSLRWTSSYSLSSSGWISPCWLSWPPSLPWYYLILLSVLMTLLLSSLLIYTHTCMSKIETGGLN